LIVPDDMEMGAVLEFAPIEQTVVEHIRAGGDLGSDLPQRRTNPARYEALIHAAERDRKFRGRVLESAGECWRSRRSEKISGGHRIGAPTAARIDKLTRQLWEFGEEYGWPRSRRGH
jgi:hypothetical protein